MNKILKLIRNPFYWVKLTDKQREAVRLACRGKRAPQIAEAMKIEISSATGLVRRAVAKINKAEGWNIKARDLPDILLGLIENEIE